MGSFEMMMAVLNHFNIEGKYFHGNIDTKDYLLCDNKTWIAIHPCGMSGGLYYMNVNGEKMEFNVAKRYLHNNKFVNGIQL